MPRKWKSYLVVAIQLAAMAFIALTGPLFAHTRNLLIMELIGIFLGLWAIFEFRKTTFRISPEVGDNAILVVSGPYRFLRHPMYTALLLIFGALVANTFSEVRLAALVILLADLIVKSRIEERYLGRRFRNFKQYSRFTYRIIPFIF